MPTKIKIPLKNETFPKKYILAEILEQVKEFLCGDDKIAQIEQALVGIDQKKLLK